MTRDTLMGTNISPQKNGILKFPKVGYVIRSLEGFPFFEALKVQKLRAKNLETGKTVALDVKVNIQDHGFARSQGWRQSGSP